MSKKTTEKASENKINNLPVQKNVILFIIVIVLAAAVLIKMFPLNFLFLSGNVEMTILKNKNSIINIDTTRDISFEQKLSIDKIDFEQGQELRHASLGKLGFTNDFFIEFKTKMIVKQDNNYKFIINSDDGFRLKINNDLISEFKGDRPFAPTEKDIFLKAGTYNLSLTYFQGFGQLGLKAYYQVADANTKFFIGQSSGFMSFKK